MIYFNSDRYRRNHFWPFRHLVVKTCQKVQLSILKDGIRFIHIRGSHGFPKVKIAEIVELLQQTNKNDSFTEGSVTSCEANLEIVELGIVTFGIDKLS